MNIHKEYDFISIQTGNKSILYQVQLDGSLENYFGNKEHDLTVYSAYDDFYIHSGAEEMITYNTVTPTGDIIEVNRFEAKYKNCGIKRSNGTKG